MSILSYPHIFPVAIVCMYVGACTRYALAGDYGRVLYWACAAGITIAATWLVGK